MAWVQVAKAIAPVIKHHLDNEFMKDITKFAFLTNDDLKDLTTTRRTRRMDLYRLKKLYEKRRRRKFYLVGEMVDERELERFIRRIKVTDHRPGMIRRKSFANPEQIESFNRLADHVRLEDHIKLQHLELLMVKFREHQPPTIVKNPNSKYEPTKYEQREPGNLNLEEFKETISSVLQTHEYDDQLEKLFLKLDTSADGYVDWDEFITYMLLQYRENDYMSTKKQIPFVVEPKIRHVLHNRQEPSQKLIAVENPVRYVSVSKEGTICVWDTNLHFERHMVMSQDDIDPTGKKRRFKTWVTDVCYLKNCRKIAIASTSRDVRFFDATSNKYFEEFNLYGLPDVPACLCYSHDKNIPSDKSLLIAGMDCGDVYLFEFHKPTLQLFEALFQHTTADGVTKIFFQDLDVHSKCVSYSVLTQVHPESIIKVAFIPENEVIISCSTSPRNSLVILDKNKKKKSYVFKLSKGVQCFDYNKSLNVLITGSGDHHVRLWNPYVTSKPTAVLQGHATGLLDIIVHEGLAQLFTYSRDAVLKVWDIKEHTCLQTVVLKFPSTLYGRLPEHGNFPFHLQNPPINSLLVACNDYIAMLRLGQFGVTKNDVPTTHKTQLCSAIYNPFYKQVVTGSDDSAIAVWDIDTGCKILQFSNAHGDEEITAMVFDGAWRRLITGARNGSIKVWNFQNGHNLHKLESVEEAEITGIVPFNDKKIILAVGWSRLITQYDDSQSDNMYISASTFWKGGQLHKDDILSLDFCPPNLLATASFDGELLVWSTDTEKLYLRLRAGQATKISEKLDANLRRLSEDDMTARRAIRPNSRHINSHRVKNGHPAPVEKLLFLKERHNSVGAILISSEAGVLRWWSIFGKKHEIGYFYASDFPDEAVLGMCSNPGNSILVSGDSRGHIYIWDIEKYCIQPEEKKIKKRPPLIASWHAHDSTIVSLEFIAHKSNQYILSASTDRTARLWNGQGHYIGTFGQTSAWDLGNASTWQHPKTPWTDEDLASVDPHLFDSPTPVPDKPVQNAELPSDADSKKPVNTDLVNNTEGSYIATGTTEAPSNFKQRSQTFAYGSLQSQKSTLGIKAEREFARMKFDRHKRRGNFGEIQAKDVQQLGQCSPYQALITQELTELNFPKDIKIATPLFQRSYTAAAALGSVEQDRNSGWDLAKEGHQNSPDIVDRIAQNYHTFSKQKTDRNFKSKSNKLPSIQRPSTVPEIT